MYAGAHHRAMHLHGHGRMRGRHRKGEETALSGPRSGVRVANARSCTIERNHASDHGAGSGSTFARRLSAAGGELALHFGEGDGRLVGFGLDGLTQDP